MWWFIYFWAKGSQQKRKYLLWTQVQLTLWRGTSDNTIYTFSIYFAKLRHHIRMVSSCWCLYSEKYIQLLYFISESLPSLPPWCGPRCIHNVSSITPSSSSSSSTIIILEMDWIIYIIVSWRKLSLIIDDLSQRCSWFGWGAYERGWLVLKRTSYNETNTEPFERWDIIKGILKKDHKCYLGYFNI